MDTDEAQRLDLAARQNGQPTPPPDLGRVEFRDGPGGDMANLWAAYMMRLWHQAEITGAKPPKFSDALKATAAHFMMGTPK